MNSHIIPHIIWGGPYNYFCIWARGWLATPLHCVIKNSFSIGEKGVSTKVLIRHSMKCSFDREPWFWGLQNLYLLALPFDESVLWPGCASFSKYKCFFFLVLLFFSVGFQNHTSVVCCLNAANWPVGPTCCIWKVLLT